MSELKPCPFCGGEDVSVSAGYWDANGARYEIGCDNPQCAVHPYSDLYPTEAEAIEAWNTRAERTCRMTDRGECSECGAYIVRAWTEVHDFNGDMKRIDLRSHNYCPNCGARVTPKNSETTPKVVS